MERLAQRIHAWLWSDHHYRDGAKPFWLTPARLAYALLHDLARGELGLRAMSLVYTTMLATVPLLAFSFSILKGLGFHRELEPVLDDLLAPLGPRAGELSDNVIRFVDNVSGSAIASVSIVLLIYSALSMAQKVESSFNFVWRVDRPRSFARRFSEYVSVMLVGPVLMSIAMGFTATLTSTSVMTRLSQAGPLGSWIASASQITPYLMVIAAFSFLYLFVPNTRVRLRPALIGGLFAGVAWAAGGRLFTAFVAGASRIEAIYSGFAIVIVTMLWLHVSWLILLIGAQLAFYLQHPDELPARQRSASLSNSLRERLALSTMLLIGRDFEQRGRGSHVDGLAARLHISRRELEPVVAALSSAELLAQTSDHRVIPAKDPRRISLQSVLDAVRRPESDTAGAAHDEANATVQALTARVDQAIREAIGDQSLADMVDDEAERAAEACRRDDSQSR
jgi:membrane protein